MRDWLTDSFLPSLDWRQSAADKARKALHKPESADAAIKAALFGPPKTAKKQQGKLTEMVLKELYPAKR